MVLRIQRELFIVAAELATSKKSRSKLKPAETLVTSNMVEILEKDIDYLTDKNGIPDFFVVPGENSISSKLNIDLTLRPQNLSPDLYYKICNLYDDLKE